MKKKTDNIFSNEIYVKCNTCATILYVAHTHDNNLCLPVSIKIKIHEFVPFF